MSGKNQGAKNGETEPQVSDDVRTTSHLRFKSPTRRDESSSDSVSWMGGFTPSTLPPAPFEHEADVSGHEWWLDAHMNAAANILCLEQLVDVVMDSADVLALERVRALIAKLGDVRDALYELYCDAADPRMRGSSTPDGPLTKYITELYAFSDLVNDRLATITTAMRTDSADWKLLAPTLDMGAPLFAEDVRRSVRDSVHGLGVDFSNHVEPLRNLPKDVEEMFLAAISLRTEIKSCL
jgi:hypothetical protein